MGEFLCNSPFLKQEGKRLRSMNQLSFKILWLPAAEAIFSYFKSKRNLLEGYDQVAYRS